MIELSKRTMGNIRQNIAIALGPKAVFLIKIIFGITGLWPAILANTGANGRDVERATITHTDMRVMVVLVQKYQIALTFHN